MVAFNTLFTALYLLTLLQLTIICVIDQKRLGLMSVSLFSHRMLSQMLRGGKFRYEWFTIISYLFIIFAQTLFILSTTHYLFPKLSANYGNGWILLGSATLVLLYHIIIEMISWVHAHLFSKKNVKEEITAQRFYFHTTLAMMLMIILPIFFYHDIVSYLVFTPLILPVLLYIFRLLRINFGEVDLFQFFLYFCTLEILPLFVVGKILLNIERSL